MPKFNLFIKIYLSFLLTIIFAMVMMTFLERLAGSGPMIDHLRHDVGRSLSFYAQESVSIFGREGLKGLIDYIKRLEKSTGTRAFFFDEKGHEMTGRAVTADIEEIATLARNNPQPDLIFSGEISMAAQSITDIGGKIYVFAVQLPHAPPRTGSHLSLFGPPPPPLRDLASRGIPLHFAVRILIELMIGGLACYLLARYMIAPIIKLGNAARQLTSGNLSIRVGPSLGNRKDEISTLASDFDHMAERIEMLLTAQRNLLRDVSHELRSPLARLNVALEICKQNFGPEGDIPLNRIERESERLNEMIGQLLTWNKVESGTTEIKKTKVDLAELIADIVADADFEGKSKNRGVVSNIEPCIVEGNRELLRRAVENIVRNAVHYTDEGSNVEMTLRCIDGADGAHVLITIRDHGKGVPDGALSELFKPFYRVGESRDRQTGGAGLGLAIADAAIRFHGGTLRAFNAPDSGLIVEMSIPMHRQKSMATQPPKPTL